MSTERRLARLSGGDSIEMGVPLVGSRMLYGYGVSLLFEECLRIFGTSPSNSISSERESPSSLRGEALDDAGDVDRLLVDDSARK